MIRQLGIILCVAALVPSCAGVEPATEIPAIVNSVPAPTVAVTPVSSIKPNNLTFVEFFSGT